MDRLGLHLSTGEHIDGLWVGTCENEPEPILRRLKEALYLIKTHDPLRYQRLTRDLKRVWALSIQYPTAYFDRRLDACMLNTQFVLAEDSTPELIASSIVHEATHARLESYGIVYEEVRRPRIEGICVRRELAFSAKLPNGQQVHEWAEHKLTSYCNHASLTNAALTKRQLDQIDEELRRLGVPPWIVGMVRVLGQAIRGVMRVVRGARVPPAKESRSVVLKPFRQKTWMRGSSPRMTNKM